MSDDANGPVLIVCLDPPGVMIVGDLTIEGTLIVEEDGDAPV